MRVWYWLGLIFSVSAMGAEPVRLYPGFVTKVRCEGKLLVSAVGDDSAVIIQALPRELGCGVLLKPMLHQGRSNLLLETSSGTVRKILEIDPRIPQDTDLEYRFSGDRR